VNITGPTPTAARALYFTMPEGLYASDDLAASWRRVSIELGAQRVFWVRPDPMRPYRLFAFVEALPGGDRKGKYLVRSDGGGKWDYLLAASNASIDIFDDANPQLVFDPTNTDRLWLTGVEEGVLFSPDSGSTWKNLGFKVQHYQVFNPGPFDVVDRSTLARRLTLSPAQPQVVFLIWGGKLWRGDFVQPEAPMPVVEFYVLGVDRYWIATNMVGDGHGLWR
jgi:hypothetical protein